MASIAIIDDDEDIRYLLQIVVESDGHEVEEFSSGEEFLEVDGRYDLVITDLAMLKMTGTEVVRRIRGQHRTVPIIVLSAMGTDDVMHETFEAGADEYLVKPFRPVELNRLIWQLIDEEPPDHVNALHGWFDGG